MIRPEYLKEGDKVAIISPSHMLAPEKLQRTREVIASWGFVPVESGIIPDIPYKGVYAQTPQKRAEDLVWALEDPEIKALFCSRGGYGTIHLPEVLPLEVLRKHPKWLIGYSDITGIHLMETAAGVMSIHGPVGSSFWYANGEDESCQTLRRLLLGEVPASYKVPAHPFNHPGKTIGRLVGGNVSTLYPFAGTPLDPTMGDDDVILLLEEVEESYHNLDRMINVLKIHGVLDRVKGIIMGEYTDCPKDVAYDSVEEMYDQYFAPLGIPVCCGFPAGHEDGRNWPLVEGAQTLLEVTEEGSEVRMLL